MKILLTGPKRVGKTTVLQKFIEKFPGEMQGVLTLRMIDKNGENKGFLARSIDGKREKIMAHQTLVQSSYTVGNNHHVDIESIESFIIPNYEKDY